MLQIQAGKDDQCADDLAKEGEDGEEGQQGAAEVGREDLGHVGLRRGHDHADGAALEALAGEEDAATPVYDRGLVGDEANGYADGREEGAQGEGGAPPVAVLEEAACYGADHGAAGGDEVPEAEPQGGEDPFFFELQVGAEVVSGFFGRGWLV